MTPDFLTLAEAAAALKVEPHHIRHLVAQGRIRCGILAPGWYGQAGPAIGEITRHWKGGVTEINPGDRRLDSWHYRCVETGEEYTVTGTWVAQFWYLHHSTAYALALNGPAGVDCEWLEPEDGDILYKEHPECFPWPDFVFSVNGEQEYSRRITWDNVLFRRQDVEALAREQKSRATESASVPIDWRDEARAIADMLFDSDTANGCRRSLGKYADAAALTMQQRAIHGPRGRLAAATIRRDALQGDRWWGRKQK